MPWWNGKAPARLLGLSWLGVGSVQACPLMDPASSLRPPQGVPPTPSIHAHEHTAPCVPCGPMQVDDLRGAVLAVSPDTRAGRIGFKVRAAEAQRGCPASQVALRLGYSWLWFQMPPPHRSVRGAALHPTKRGTTQHSHFDCPPSHQPTLPTPPPPLPPAGGIWPDRGADEAVGPVHLQAAGARGERHTLCGWVGDRVGGNWLAGWLAGWLVGWVCG